MRTAQSTEPNRRNIARTLNFSGNAVDILEESTRVCVRRTHTYARKHAYACFHACGCTKMYPRTHLHAYAGTFSCAYTRVRYHFECFAYVNIAKPLNFVQILDQNLVKI